MGINPKVISAGVDGVRMVALSQGDANTDSGSVHEPIPPKPGDTPKDVPPYRGDDHTDSGAVYGPDAPKTEGKPEELPPCTDDSHTDSGAVYGPCKSKPKEKNDESPNIPPNWFRVHAMRFAPDARVALAAGKAGLDDAFGPRAPA